MEGRKKRMMSIHFPQLWKIRKKRRIFFEDIPKRRRVVSDSMSESRVFARARRVNTEGNKRERVANRGRKKIGRKEDKKERRDDRLQRRRVEQNEESQRESESDEEGRDDSPSSWHDRNSDESEESDSPEENRREVKVHQDTPKPKSRKIHAKPQSSYARIHGKSRTKDPKKKKPTRKENPRNRNFREAKEERRIIKEERFKEIQSGRNFVEDNEDRRIIKEERSRSKDDFPRPRKAESDYIITYNEVPKKKTKQKKKKKKKRIQYKAYTVEDYKSQKQGFKALEKLGGLGADLSREEVVKRKAKENRMKEYSEKLRQMNKHVLKKKKRKPVVPTEKKSKKSWKRERAKEFASKVRDRNVKKKSFSAPKKKRTSNTTANDNSSEEDEGFEPEAMSEIEKMELQHQKDTDWIMSQFTE